MKHLLPIIALLSCWIALVSCASAQSTARTTSSTEDKATRHQTDETRRKANDYIGIGPLGGQKNPIKCDGMAGIRSYLEKLRGPEKQRIQFGEPQDMGVGPFESLIYAVSVEYLSKGKPVQTQLFFDPDFPGYREIKPAAGFKWAD